MKDKMSEEKKFAWFSLGSMDNLRKKSGLSCSFIIFAALNIAMAAVGAEAINDCPVDPMIPIYLIGKSNVYLNCGTFLVLEIKYQQNKPHINLILIFHSASFITKRLLHIK